MDDPGCPAIIPPPAAMRLTIAIARRFLLDAAQPLRGCTAWTSQSERNSSSRIYHYTNACTAGSASGPSVAYADSASAPDQASISLKPGRGHLVSTISGTACVLIQPWVKLFASLGGFVIVPGQRCTEQHCRGRFERIIFIEWVAVKCAGDLGGPFRTHQLPKNTWLVSGRSI